MYGPVFSVEYLLSKFAESVTVSRPLTGEVLYYSNKLTEANGTVSVTMGEIRAGVGNPIIGVIPSDANATVEITDQTLSLAMRAYQTGGLHGYGAPVLVCVDVEVADGSTSIGFANEDNGTPVAGVGFDKPYAYVQKIGEKSTIFSDGTPHEINVGTTDSSVSGTFLPGSYKVWYWVDSPTAEYTTILANIDPSVVNVRLVYPVYSNVKEDGSGTRIGSLIVIYPYLKLNANAGVNGNSSGNMTTSVSGTAISYEDATVKAGCGACQNESSALVHYIYAACDGGENLIQGLVFPEGTLYVDESDEKQIKVYLVVNGNLVVPDPVKMTYTVTQSLTGLSVGSNGVVSAGSTTGSAEVRATYEAASGNNYNCFVNVTVNAK